MPQTVASSMRPPSSGKPGSALNAAKIRLSSASEAIVTATHPFVSVSPTQKAPASTSVVAGPTNATRNSPRGPFPLAFVSVAPPQNTRVMPETGRSSDRAMTAWAASCSNTLPKKSTAASTAIVAASEGSTSMRVRSSYRIHT